MKAVAEDRKELVRSISHDSQNYNNLKKKRDRGTPSMYSYDEILNIAKNCGDYRLLNETKKMDYHAELRSFAEILNVDEKLLFFVSSMIINRGMDSTNYVGCLAVTNERVLLYYQRIFQKQKSIATLSLDNIVSANPSRTLLNGGVLTIDTIGITDRIVLQVLEKEYVNTIATKFMDAIKAAKEMRKEKNETPQQLSSADELLKFKGLLDAGVITQEEFDAKKKQLLGL